MPLEFAKKNGVEPKDLYVEVRALENINNIMIIFNNAILSNCDISSLFESCLSLESINLENLDFTNVTKFDFMFYGCCSLVDITSPTKTITEDNSNKKEKINDELLFEDCEKLSSLSKNEFINSL